MAKFFPRLARLTTVVRRRGKNGARKRGAGRFNHHCMRRQPIATGEKPVQIRRWHMARPSVLSEESCRLGGLVVSGRLAAAVASRT